MMVPASGQQKILHWVGWASALLAVSLAVLIVSSNLRQRRAVADQVREQQHLKMVAAKYHIERYLDEICLCLKLISLDDHLENMTRDSHDYLQALYEASHERHFLDEIYVIERDFDGTRRPFLTFEKADQDHEVEELHSLEREAAEYAQQIEHIRRFSDEPELKILISEPLPLCIGKPGFVCSIPIWSGAHLLGIVAGMVSADNVSEVLEDSSLGNMLVLANDHGTLIGCSDLPPEVRSWFQRHFEQIGVRDFFESRDEVFRVGHFAALWTRPEIPGEQEWYLAFVYDEAAHLQGGGLSAALAGWGSAGIVLVLGGAIVFLCRITPALMVARQQADSRARELTESATRLREAQRIAHMGSWDWDIVANEVRWSDEVYRIFGLGPQEFGATYDAFLASVHPNDRKSVQERVDAALQDSAEYSIDYRILLPCGEVRHVHEQGEVTRDLDGRPIRMVGTVTDITERKRAEQERDRLSDLSLDLICVAGFDGYFKSLNPAFERTLGYANDELLGKPFVEFVHPKDRAATLAEMDRLASGATAVQFENRYRCKDGTYRWLAWNAVPDVDRAVTYAVARDMTEHKRAEEAMRESQAFLQRVVDGVPDAVMVIDRDYHIVLANRTVREMAGGHDPVSARLTCYQTSHHRDVPCPEGEACPCPLRQVFSTQSPTVVLHTHLDAAGNELQLEIVAAPVFNENGEVVQVIEACRDVTARVRAEELARQRQVELARVARLGTMGEMAAGLAHELNQPLAAIVNYIQACLERMKGRGGDYDELRDDMEQAAAQAERAGEIIEHVRNFVHKREPERTAVDINDLVKEAVDLLRSEMRHHGIQLRLDLADSLPPVLAEPIQIEQVIVNLVRNSLEAMSAGGRDARHLNIETLRAAGDWVEIAVRDTGAGLSAGAAEWIFDPFFTTKPDGMGMGLSISRSIIEAHGGRLWAVPNPDCGVTFRFTLPIIDQRS
jgi:PAS domain S-box-containing protein